MYRLVLALSLTIVPWANGGEVIRVEWPTKHAAPAMELKGEAAKLLPLAQMGAEVIPEPMLLNLAFAGSPFPKEAVGDLQVVVSNYYKRMQTDDEVPAIPSAMSYCLSASKPTHGVTNVYVPKDADKDTPAIVFLHGYGGSFSFYLHYLAKTFPDHIIVCPAYGISTWDIPHSYVQECLNHTSAKLGFKLQKPVLVGLSAGGMGGFKLYNKQSRDFTGYICLAHYPMTELRPFPRHGRIRLLAGADEFFVKNGWLKQGENALRRDGSDYASKLIPGGDHFFLLRNEKETKEILREWVAELSR